MEKKLNPKQLQDICTVILESQGKSYKDWLYECQLNLLLENSGFLTDRLKNTNTNSNTKIKGEN